MLKYNVTTRNAKLDAMITSIGVGAIMRIRTGAAPLTCALPDFGTVIATLALPNPWMLAATSGAISKTGTWQDLYADNTGVAGHFRIYDSGGTCRMQGKVTATNGDGDLILSSTGLAAGQYFTVTSFTITDQNG